MRLCLLLIKCCFITAIKSPFHFQKLSIEMEKANLPINSASSCLNTVSFLVSRFTKYSMIEAEKKIEANIKKYKYPAIVQQDLSKINLLKSILDNKFIKRFIAIIIDVIGSQDHYVLIEKNNEENTVSIYQSFQNVYTLWQSISVVKVFSFDRFIDIIKNILSLSKSVVHDSIKDLICYQFLQEAQCSSVQSYFTGPENMDLLEQADAYLGNGILIQENLKQLNFRPLNLDFLPLNDFEELAHPILMPLSNAEKKEFIFKSPPKYNRIAAPKTKEESNNKICCSIFKSKEKTNSIKCKCYS